MIKVGILDIHLTLNKELGHIKKNKVVKQPVEKKIGN